MRLLLVATFRDTDAEMPDALAETLADLRRSEDVVRLRLGGLSGAEVTEFVRRAAGGDRGVPEVARAISDMTAGNAFLVCELWRALVDSEAVEVADGALRLTRPLDELGTPGERARGRGPAAGQRCAPATADLLELAATAGAEFDLEVLRAPRPRPSCCPRSTRRSPAA